MDKEFKTIDEQILLLKSRNLQFNDEQAAREILKKYNYFDIINGTEGILLKSVRPKNYEGIFFEDFHEIYKFDARLRILVLQKILDIEARLRTSIARNFAGRFCATAKDTLNYRERKYYKAPDRANGYLFSTFMKFDLFKKNEIMPNGTVKLGFVERKKKDKDYVRTYAKPPFWVIIKDFSFGDLYFTYCFQQDIIKSEILRDFNLSPGDDALFQQILHTLKYARNCCAHIELITRFRLLGIPELNKYRELKEFIKSAHRHLSCYDLLNLLSRFCDVKELAEETSDFHRNMYLMNRTRVAEKLLKRMGNGDIEEWRKFSRMREFS